MLFSATFPGKLREVASLWVGRAVTIRCNTLEINVQLSHEDKKAWERAHGKDGTKNGQKEDEVEDETDGTEGIGASVSDMKTCTRPQADTKDRDNKRQKGGGLDASDYLTSSAACVGEVESPGIKRPQAVQVAPSSSSSIAQQGKYESTLTVSDSITQLVHVCVPHKKPRLLLRFIERVRKQESESKKRQPGPMIIFCAKIKTVKFVISFLKKQEYTRVAELHGDLKQQDREKTLVSHTINLLSVPLHFIIQKNL